MPVPVATSTRRRQRPRAVSANCWASAPPQEMPSTSTVVVAELVEQAGQHAGQSGEPVGDGPAAASRPRRARRTGSPRWPGRARPRTARRPPGWPRCRCTAAAAAPAPVAGPDRDPDAAGPDDDGPGARPRAGASDPVSDRRHRCPARARRTDAGHCRAPRARVPRRRCARRASGRSRPTSCPSRSSPRQPLLGIGRGVRGRPGSSALGLPGGLTMEAMCPLVDSTNRVVPPSSWVRAVAGLPRAQVIGDAGHDVGVGVDLADRSTGLPSIVALPGTVSALSSASSMKSRCIAAVMRVVSAFQ